MTTIQIYTDGACSGNPGPGGWGAVLIWKDQRKTFQGGALDTTNNRMELQAVISALEQIKQNHPIEIYTDSVYVQQGMKSWIANWKANNWQNSQRKAVKNQDLWQQLDKFNQQFQISWHWVKGHNGHPLNEEADALARAGLEVIKQRLQNK